MSEFQKELDALKKAHDRHVGRERQVRHCESEAMSWECVNSASYYEERSGEH